MQKLFKDYYWKNGIPYGRNSVDSSEIENCDSYKIVSDPYGKHISIEKYSNGRYIQTVYDSNYLDFRHLRPERQVGWEKIIIQESSSQLVCLIRNQDDRVVFFETHFFENDLCRKCRVESPQGIHLSTQRMFYTLFGDPFNGVVLYDQNDHLVLIKRYAISDKQEFTELIEENWDLSRSDLKNGENKVSFS